MVTNEIKSKLKKDDTVEVIAGKNKGKRGAIIKLDRKNGRAIVQGVNLVKKAMKKRKQTDRGGIIEIEAALDMSNLMIICKKCGVTRVGYKGEKKDKKRICRKCGEVL